MHAAKVTGLIALALAGCGARSTLDVATTEVADAGPIADVAVVDVPATHRLRVFVTREKWNGDLVSAAHAAGHLVPDGPAAADALCDDVAHAAGLQGNWVSWISETTDDAIDRIADIGPWYGLDGQKVFDDKAELKTNPLAAILTDETGGTTDLAVWTGTRADGSVAPDTCHDWTSSSPQDHGLCGYNNTTTHEKWSEGVIPACDGEYNLYCFEQ